MRIPVLIAIFAITAWAAPKLTFHQSRDRYIAGHDLLRILSQKFPKVDWRKTDGGCAFLFDGNRAALGDSNPFNGEVTYPAPSTAFVRWYTRCLRIAVQEQVPSVAQGEKPWAQVPLEDQKNQIRDWVHEYIGPGIVADEEALIEKLHAASTVDNLSTLEATRKIILQIALDENFLTY